jgi:hypothetical protein
MQIKLWSTHEQNIQHAFRHRTMGPDCRWNRSPAMQMMFGSIRAINPSIPEPQKSIDTLENPDVFKLEMQDAGFREVKIHKVCLGSRNEAL